MKYIDRINTLDLKDLDINELKLLCSEIRDFIVDSVTYTGGHLGSSLGTVELTIALHKVFDLPKDKLVWDIGHQSYTHKILTGRKNKFSTLRKKDGISGFSAPFESEYDPFIGGHSSTSISSGFGLKKGLEMQGDNSRVISIIGDSSIASGMALEAVNHVGSTKSNMIVILNDNEMSISKPQGALSKYLIKIKSSNPFLFVKEKIRENVGDKLPKPLSFLAEKADSLTRITKEANIFESLGFSYIGALDGHDIESLVEILESIKNHDSHKPILLHIITKKGKGYEKAENAADCLHGVEGKVQQNFPKEDGEQSNTEIFVESLIENAKNDEKIIAITAGMPTGTGLNKFEAVFPERFIDVGIAEQHAVTFAAGLAKSSMKPFVCIYSTFIQRAYDQVVHDVAISSLPVRFIMDRAGFVGADGATHHGLLDYAMFLPLPNLVFMSPSCKEDIPQMINLMSDINDKPSFIRFAKAKHLKSSYPTKIELGKGCIISQGKDIAILSIGEILGEVIKASEKLKKEGIYITIADAKFARPLDEALIINLATNHKILFIVEEGYSGVFASLIHQVIVKNSLSDKVILNSISVPAMFIEQSEIEEQREIAKIDSESIHNFIKTNI